MLREYLEAMRALWSQEEAEYERRVRELRPVLGLAQTGAGPLPVLVGASGNEKNFKWIARSADGWITTPGDQDIEASVRLLQQIWADAGREGAPQIVVLDFKPDPEKLAAGPNSASPRSCSDCPTSPRPRSPLYVERLAGKLAALVSSRIAAPSGTWLI